MHPNRLVTICLAALAAATLVSGSALAKGSKPSGSPKNLRAFLLSPSEPVSHVFSRTPAFAWSPVSGAACYEFELSTSRAFGENSIVWSNVGYGVKPGGGCAAVAAISSGSSASASPTAPTPSADSGTAAPTAGTAAAAASDPAVTSLIQPLRVPAVSVDIALPWFTGQPYALYSRARAITQRGPTGWSKPFAFNMRWPSVPTPLPTQPGLVRWTSVSGATGYQVWFPDAQKSFSTHTNVADLREFYTLRSLYPTVRWRIRAIRRVFGDIPNGLPAVSYGPWSPTYTATNPAPVATALSAKMALSDGISDGVKQSAHALMPGLVFSGDLGLDNAEHLVSGYPLFRAYASTDRDCVNVVFRGSIVGSPAYAPRTTGPLAITADGTPKSSVIPDGTPGPEYSADWRLIKSNEEAIVAAVSASSPSDQSPANTDQSGAGVGARVDLPDIDFPTTRYYWTVVPVIWAVNPSDPTKFGWWDVETPQDACAAGRVESFGKESAPVRTGAANGSPYVSGLKPNGRLLATAGRRPTVYSTPLISWEPAVAATSYEVQWSRTSYPWRAQGSKMTYSTSAVLDLAAGKWYYRVRGHNQNYLKADAMSWSTKIAITVAKPKFRLVSSSK